MSEFTKAYVGQLLNELEARACLFPQFVLKKVNNELQIMGTGGFASVYEMYNKERTEMSYALKVIGFQNHTLSSTEFWNTTRIQWILCQESKYIMRVLDARDLFVFLDDEGYILDVKDATKEIWEENGQCLHLQFILLEKLEKLIEKDRFGKVRILREELTNKEEILKFALEIGQAVAIAHENQCLHRDIKIENIFWDAGEKVYKLGDFGIAKWSEDGEAETVVYTDGYGAPEIERRLYDHYNATADIYSFGITLYLLFNEFRFPGSDGYYSKVEVQYRPDFIFPAPIHASEAMARMIRKMCSFQPEERYQSMNEVLAALSDIVDSEGMEISDELFELADIATETYRAETDDTQAERVSEGKGKTRAERKEEQKMAAILYREDSVKFFVIITLLLVAFFKSVQTDSTMITDWLFYILPGMVLFEALLQNIKEFHIFFSTIILVLLGMSVYVMGLTVPHVILMLCVLSGYPVLTSAAACSVGVWMLLERTGTFAFLNCLSKWHLGCIWLIAIVMVVIRYFLMRKEWGMYFQR